MSSELPTQRRQAPETGPDTLARPGVSLGKVKASDLPVSFGRYVLQDLLGEGGMARVFRAELQGPAGFRKQVALKLIKPEAGGRANPQEVMDLIREACLGGRLKHPHIVDVYELGEVDGQLFISMELVDGLTLAQLIRSRATIPSSVVMEISVAIASGLAKAHGFESEGRRVESVHRDLKPANILLSWDGAIKIADFGIAITQEGQADRNEATELSGTPSYMSPEQIKGEVLDGRSDLFALALVIAAMVWGKNPLGDGRIVNRVLSGQPLVPPLLDSAVVADLEEAVPGLGDVLSRCLEPQCSHRYPNAEALGEVLQTVQDGVGHIPRLGSWLDKTWKKGLEEELTQPADATVKWGEDGETLNLGIETEDTAALPPPAARSNLGPPLDAFVGRASALEGLERLFGEGARLVTMKGTGGAGKTRVGRQYARRAAEELSGGAWFVDLTEARSLMGVLHATATALGVPLGSASDVDGLVTKIGQAIAERGAVLLVFDNFEQVVEHAPATVGCWLEGAVEARFLVTTRESLRLVGEQVFSLEPLSIEEGVALFELRAAAAGARLGQDDKTHAAVSAIVKQLDGLPLAIELAAARARMLSPDQILGRLSERFRLLRGGKRDHSKRQASLQGLIDWSWDLLEPWEQAALAQLSVFRGGFDMEAAEEVLDLSAWPDAPWSLDVVGSLFDKSLLHSREVYGQPRFGMYVSIRAYAHGKLSDSAEVRGTTALKQAQQHHARFFSQMGTAESLRALDGVDSAKRWEVLFCELDNLVAAIEYGTAETAPLCCLAALKVLIMKGPVSLGVDLANQVLQRQGLSKLMNLLVEIERSKCLRISGRMAEARAMVSDPEAEKVEPATVVKTRVREERTKSGAQVPEDGAKAGSATESAEDRELALAEAERLLELGRIEAAQSNYDRALHCYMGALELFRDHADRAREGKSLTHLGNALRAKGQHDRAIEVFTQAIAIHRRVGDKHSNGRVLANLGNVYLEQGKHDRAIEVYAQAIAIHREIGNKLSEGVCLGNIGKVYLEQGQHDRAIEVYAQALAILREVGDWRSEGVYLGNLGHVYANQGQHDRAIEHYTLAIAIHREIGNKRAEGVCLGNLGDTLVQLDRADEAEAAFRQAISIGDETVPVVAGAFRGSLALLVAQQGEHHEGWALLETGEPLVESYPEEHAKFLCKKGRVQLLTGQSEDARASLEQARGIAAELKVTDDSEVGQAIAVLDAMLGDGESGP